MAWEKVMPDKETRVEEALAMALLQNTNMRERLIDEMMDYMEARPRLFTEETKFTRDDCEMRIIQIFGMEE